MRLYDYELSGNCYKIRLFLSILGKSFDTQTVDFYPGREHKSEAFLALNPLGQLPILEDAGQVLSGSDVILSHLAAQYDASHKWHPQNLRGDISKWMQVADEITTTSSAARLHDTFFYDLNIDTARAGAKKVFRSLDEHLWFAEQRGHDWLVPAGHPTVADIACFPYVALSEEGGISRQDYPAIRRWCDRIKRIDGFLPMPGIFPTSKAV
jgi:glutathione S-transferase